MDNQTVTRYRYRLRAEWEIGCRDDFSYSPSEFSGCFPYTPLPRAEARLATKAYVEHRKRFIQKQLECNKRMEETLKEGFPMNPLPAVWAEHEVFWRRPYVPEEDPDTRDAARKKCFLSGFRLIPPTAPRAYPCRRSAHTLPNSRVEEHITQPILWQGLEAYDREFGGLDNAREDLPTYLAKFLASQENLSGNSDNMPRYGRSPILHQNS